MTHPITMLQAGLVAALQADAALAGVGVLDAPTRDTAAPFLAIARHDLVPRDGDAAPGWEHRLAMHAWAKSPSRAEALALADRVLEVAESFEIGGLVVTHWRHERTETAIDAETGRARALVALRFFTEAV
ncbi:DUF3168 domain-containing protein [Devosia sp.]|uniref:DUF3168 domain-containing protein n=1 Tax=Devosia sp. TaxID=1871048 RepID=UPI003A91B4B1